MPSRVSEMALNGDRWRNRMASFLERPFQSNGKCLRVFSNLFLPLQKSHTGTINIKPVSLPADRMSALKPHLTVAVCGHLNSGKSSLVHALCASNGDQKTCKSHDTASGPTVQSSACEMITDGYHYSMVDVPGHRNYIKNMIRGASTADIGILVVPADASFSEAVNGLPNKATKKTIGQCQHHALILSTLGVSRLVVAVTKMDVAEGGSFNAHRFNEIKKDTLAMLSRVKGSKPAQLELQVAFVPICVPTGDNIATHSSRGEAGWWKGQNIQISCDDGRKPGPTRSVTTLLEALAAVSSPNPNHRNKLVTRPLRLAVNGVVSVNGETIVTGRVEQGEVVANKDVIFLPTHTAGVPCAAKVSSIEMHHKRVEKATPGDNVGVALTDMTCRPKIGDVMVIANDTTLATAERFTAQVIVRDCAGEIKVGYTPSVFIHSAHVPCKIVDIKKANKSWDVDAKLVRGDIAAVVFEPQKPIVVEAFQDSAGVGAFSRALVMDGNVLVMMGRVTSVSSGNGIE